MVGWCNCIDNLFWILNETIFIDFNCHFVSSCRNFTQFKAKFKEMYCTHFVLNFFNILYNHSIIKLNNLIFYGLKSYSFIIKQLLGTLVMFISTPYLLLANAILYYPLLKELVLWWKQISNVYQDFPRIMMQYNSGKINIPQVAFPDKFCTRQ